MRKKKKNHYGSVANQVFEIPAITRQYLSAMSEILIPEGRFGGRASIAQHFEVFLKDPSYVSFVILWFSCHSMRTTSKSRSRSAEWCRYQSKLLVIFRARLAHYAQ